MTHSVPWLKVVTNALLLLMVLVLYRYLLVILGYWCYEMTGELEDPWQ